MTAGGTTMRRLWLGLLLLQQLAASREHHGLHHQRHHSQDRYAAGHGLDQAAAAAEWLERVSHRDRDAPLHQGGEDLLVYAPLFDHRRHQVDQDLPHRHRHHHGDDLNDDDNEVPFPLYNDADKERGFSIMRQAAHQTEVPDGAEATTASWDLDTPFTTAAGVLQALGLAPPLPTDAAYLRSGMFMARRRTQAGDVLWPVKKEAVVDGELVLGGLMMVHEREDSVVCGPIMPQGGIQALEAMLYTLDFVNKDLKFLPGVQIGAHILDDCDKDTYGLEMAVDFIKGA